MAQIPTGLLTRDQIVDHALRRCGNTKPSVRLDAFTALNQILFDLYTQYEWPFMIAVETLAITSSQFTLPLDFLVPQDDRALLITMEGNTPQRFPVLEVDRGQFEQFDPQTTGTPTIWHADRANGLGLVWPSPLQPCTATLRYRRLPDALTLGDEIPDFPWHAYLIQAVYVWALEYDSDPRSMPESARADEMLRRLRQTSSPLRSQSTVIPLDPQVFRSTTFNGDC